MAAKLTPVLQEKFDRAKPDFAPVAAKLSKADAQAVLIIASDSSVVEANIDPARFIAESRCRST